MFIRVQNLKKYFPIKTGVLKRVSNYVHAVDDVSFEIARGETFGLVGESGCGKTTIGRVLVGLYPPTAGKVWFDGQDLCQIDRGERRAMRRRCQIVFQDPFSSLDSFQRIGNIIAEPLHIHHLPGEGGPDGKVLELMDTVGLDRRLRDAYPEELSAGQQQLVAIARVLGVEPEFIVADEIVSSVDVSAQAQILNLMSHLQHQLGLTYLFISHALNVVKHVCDRIAVMYLGKLVELAQTEELAENPCHPYTKALFSAIPDPTPGHKRVQRLILEGEVPSPIKPPPGCRFHPRCSCVENGCSRAEPPLVNIGRNHWVACPRCG